MENEINQSRAYYESGRVVFTYLNGYYCDSIEIEGSSTGQIGSILNAGQDHSLVRAILAGQSSSSLSEQERAYAVKVAKKLMNIYCAGCCALTFYLNDENLPSELNMDMPATDMKNIEKIQAFLKMSVVDHSDDYATETIMSILKKIAQPEIWNPIKALAIKVLQSETKSLSGFYIEDTLMVHGIKRQKQTSSAGYIVDIHEDKTKNHPTPEVKNTSFAMPDLSPLDILLGDFLKKIKTDWKEGELNAGINHLKNVFKKYGE